MEISIGKMSFWTAGQALSDFAEFGISPWVHSIRMTEQPRPTLVPAFAGFRVSDLEDHEKCG